MNDREDRKKKEERFWVLQAALKLNETWEIQQREEPDFGITFVAGQFGLEVTECQIGLQNRKGSAMRKTENYNKKLLEQVRQNFENSRGIYLDVQYLGDATEVAMDGFLKALLNADLGAQKEFADRVQINFLGGKAFVRRTPSPHWISVHDQVGWVSQEGKFLQREIDKKSQKLEKYREAFSDVRLLVIADRTHNSGKLILEESFQPNLKGFDAVYFFSYPMEVTPFYPEVKNTACAAI